MELRERLTPFGVWAGSLQWPADTGRVAAAAAELEDLGFGAVWLGLSAPDLALHETLLAATSRLVVASGIVSIWDADPADLARRVDELQARYDGRFVLGLGNGHAVTVEAAGQRYVKPYSKTVEFLDGLDAATPPVAVGQRVLAALRPRMLRLAGERTAGAHPYLVTPEHTASARELLGSAPLLVPEQKVVLTADAAAARATARRRLDMYLDLPNYTGMHREYGFDDADFADGGSDRWVDAFAAWGTDEVVRARLAAHHDAGADHVVVQVVTDHPDGDLPLPEWRRLAEILRG